MKKLLLLLFFVSTLSFAQQTYYSDVNLTLTGTALRDELATKIISTHSNFLSYSNVWDASKVTDLDPDDLTNSNVLLIYGYSDIDGNYVTDRTRNKNLNGGTAGTQWNREHSYPKSLGNPNLGTSGPGSDAHHLRPSDITFNGQRGSLKFATGSGTAGGSNGGWYPGEEWKGDVARMMMYMYLRYGSRCLPSNVAIGSNNAADSNMIDLLLDWNAADPVSIVEDNRNTYHENTTNAYAQGNRNPFIDNPNLATQIWGGTPAEDRWNVAPDNDSPTAPTNLAGTNITNTSVDLTWTASTDNVAVTSYEIYVNDGGGDVLFGTSSTTATTLTGLTINTTYDITVYAKDAAENTSGASNILNITTTNNIDNTAPSIPTNLAVSNETSTSIDISWTASTDDQAVKEYDIYVDGSYNATSIATTFTVDNLTATTTYSFSVLARDTSDNDSVLSAAVDGTTTAAPSFCGSESFTNIGANSSSYSNRTWTGDDGGTWDATGARTDQTITGKAITIRNGTLTTPSSPNGIGELTVTTKLPFSDSPSNINVKVNGVVVGTIPYNSSATTTTIPNINISGSITIVFDGSTSSNRVSIDDLSWTCFASSDTEAPSTINDLNSANVTSNSADLSWTAATDNVGVTYYEIFKDGVFLASSATNSYAVSGLSGSTSYDFTVYAKDAAGNTSLVSNTETFTTLAGSSAASEIFISEYVEGSSNNKAIEIANFTGGTIDLSVYTLKRDANGGGWGAAVNLSGNLSSGSVFVVANSSASAAIQSVADLTSGADALIFNGNDAVGLFKNDVLIDIVGTFGSSTVFAEDTTLRRKSTITAPNTTYTVSEWDSFAEDTIDGLGNHNVSTSDTVAPSTISDLSSSNITSTTADLSWTAATDNVGVTSYEIYQDGVFLASSATNSYAVSGLTASTSYDFTVYAIDAAGNTSLVSNTETFTTLAGSSNPTELFISEYVEGTGTNKAIEIANFTGSSIDLSIYSLAREYSGTGGWKTILNLTGTIATNDVFVAANSSDGIIVAAADYIGTDDALLFSGDDPVGLFKNGVLIDVVGTFNGATGNFAANTTLRRKPTISSPNTTYTVSEWDSYPVDTYSGLGSHTLSSLSVQKYIDNLFTVYPNPTKTNSATVAVKNNTKINAVQLYNLLGQLIVNIENSADFNSKIEVTNIPSGFYIVKVFNKTSYSTKRLLVE